MLDLQYLREKKERYRITLVITLSKQSSVNKGSLLPDLATCCQGNHPSVHGNTHVRLRIGYFKHKSMHIPIYYRTLI